MAVELLDAYISLVPSARGITQKLFDELEQPAGRAGKAAGDEAARAFQRAFLGDDPGAAAARDIENELKGVDGRRAGGTAAGEFEQGFDVDLSAEGAEASDSLLDGFGGLLAGGAVAALFVDGFNTGVEQEGANNRTAASLGLSDAETAELGAVAGELYADAYGESIEEVNSALRGIIVNVDGVDLASGELDDLGIQALDLASIMEEDVARVTRGTGQLIRNGLVADAEEGFDLITAAAQRLPQEMQGELIDTTEEYAADLQALGLTGAEAFGGLTAAVGAGARNIDLAADAYREFSIRAIDGSATSAAGFEALGLNAETMTAQIALGGDAARDGLSETIQALVDLDDAALQEQAGVALFGTRFEELGIDAIAALDPATAALTIMGDEAETAGERLNSGFGVQIESAKRSLQAGFVTVMTEGVIPAIEFLSENDAALAALAVTLGTLLVPSLISTGTAALSAAVGTTLFGAPIILVAAGLAGLTAGLIWAYENVDFFRESVDIASAFITDTALPVVEDIAGAFLDDLGGAVSFVSGVFTGTLIPAGEDVVGFINGKFIGPIGTAIGYVDDLGLAAEIASDLVLEKFDDAVGFVEEMPGRISGAASGMWDGISDAFSGAMNSVIRGWNGLSFSLPSIDTPFGSVGGFTLSTPNIPLLADGNVATEPTLAVFGEYPGATSNPEITAPQQTLVDTIVAPLLAAFATSSGRGDAPAVAIENWYSSRPAHSEIAGMNRRIPSLAL